MMANIMVKSCLTQEIIKISNLIQVKENSACPKKELMRKPNFSESRICPNTECSEFRSVDWTHDMIIVKWHLLIWHKRKLCALTNSPHERVNDYQRYSMLILFCRSGLCPAPLAIHLRSKLQQADDQFCMYFFPLSSKKNILKNFLCMWW